MQTTLLGLTIGLILALIAALIGPYFIDWNQFRPQFEAEASRIIGAPVRVSGDLQARLLPTPTLRLAFVAVGGPEDHGKVRADKLDVEFSLGDLMRGTWRANELTVTGMALDLGLDQRGRIDWPVANGGFNWASLSIDRLNLTGRVALHDAASRSTLELKDIAFSGDVRSLAGAVHGEGNVTVGGARYPFRVSSAQTTEANGTHIHLNVDPGERPISGELDGVLSFEARAPRFEGTVMLAPAPAPAEIRTPWHLTSRIKADHAAAELEQIDGSFGSEERALRFTGLADMRFGASPLLHAVLSAHQLDADRLIAKDGAADPTTEPVRLWPALRALATSLPRPPFPLRIEASSEQLMLGGRPLQNLSAELRADPSSWALDRLDLRAPGSTHIAFNGAPASSNFTGTLDIDSSEPDVLMGWLQGRGDFPKHSGKPLRLHGNIGLGADGVTVDGLRAEVEGGSVQGRFALSAAHFGANSRLEAALRADQLDLDAATAFARSIAGPSADWPDRATVSLDVARATAAGQELRPFVVRFNYSPQMIALEQLKLGQADGLTMEGSGSFDRSDATGTLALRARAPSLSAVSALIAPAAPALSQHLNALPTPAGPASLMLELDIGKSAEQADHGDARANFELSAPQLKATATIAAKPQLAAIRSVDLDGLSRSEVSVTTRLSSERSNSMLVLLGLDKVIAAGQGPARLEGSVTGKWRAPLQLAATITGAGLDANVQGTVEPWAQDLKAGVNLRVRNANLAPLFGLGAGSTLAQNIDLSSRVSLAGNKVTFDDIDGTTAGSRLRGHLALALGDPKEMQGEVGLDVLKLAPVFGLAIGAAGRDPAEPLGVGLARGWRGRVAFQALRGELPGGGELRPVSGVIKSDGQGITFDTLKGKIGGGAASATIDARDGANGLALNANVELKDVDGSALHFRGLKMPPGSTSLQMALTSQGRSVSALTGALSGSGTATLQGASIMGLDPRAFELAIRASDDGQPMSDAKLRQIVEPALASGALLVSSAQIPFTIRDGRLSISPTALEGDGVSAIISGGYDVPADHTDIRASLTSTAIGSGSAGPEIKLFAAGPSGALTRNVDVTALSSWLAVRAVDRETKRLDTIERSEPSADKPAAAPPSTAALPLPAIPDVVPSDQPSPGRDPRRLQARPELKPLRRPDAPVLANPPPPLSEQVAPLPAPIEVRPPPGPAPVPTKPKPRPPLMLTPPPATTP